MEVKIDADELCELRNKAKSMTWDYGKVVLTGALARAEEKIKKLEEERDWWRKSALRVCEYYDGYKNRINLATGYCAESSFGNTVESAKHKGYDVP